MARSILREFMVTFYLEHVKQEISSIRATISYAGVKYTFATGVSVETDKFVNQRCKAGKDAAAVNNRLMAVQAAMVNAVLFFKQDFKVPDQRDFRRKVQLFLEGNNAIDIKRREQRLVDYAEEYIAGCGLAEETVKGYVTAKNKLAEYEKEKKVTLYFEDITLKFEQQFKNWLIQHHYSRNYIGTIIKNLKRFMEVAMKVDKLHSCTDFKDFKVEAEVADAFYLSVDELLQIYRLKIDAELVMTMREDARKQNVEATVRALNAVKDRFLIGAFCCMRVSNFSRISEYNIEGRTIKLMPRKGSTLRKPKPVVIPMHWVVAEILQGGCDLSESVADVLINRHIKTICRLSGINERVVYYRTEGRELKQYVAEKWEVITSHTARRSGATNMYLAGMPLDLIMFCGGWSKREQCEKYIKASVSDVVERLEATDYFAKWEDRVTIDDVTVDWVRLRMTAKGVGKMTLSERLGVHVDELRRVISAGELTKWERAALFLALR